MKTTTANKLARFFNASGCTTKTKTDRLVIKTPIATVSTMMRRAGAKVKATDVAQATALVEIPDGNLLFWNKGDRTVVKLATN